MITGSLVFTRDHHITPSNNSGIHDTTVILSRSHKDQPTSFSSNRVIINKIIILLTHSVSYYELCPYPRTRLSIDYTLCRGYYTVPTPRNSWPRAPIRVDQRR